MTNKELAMALSDYQSCDACMGCKGDVFCRNCKVEVNLPKEKYPYLHNLSECKSGRLRCEDCPHLRSVKNGACARRIPENRRKIDLEIATLMEDMTDGYSTNI